jgi:ribonuclease HI
VIGPTAERVVDIYTNGACSGNPGPGGWGALLRYGVHEKEIFGDEATATTSNRMELMAAVKALESLTRPSVVRLHTDSTYLLNGATKRVGKVGQTSDMELVKNADLWQRLDAAASPHEVQWLWVKGHAGHSDNERANRLAATGLQQANPTATGSSHSRNIERHAQPGVAASTSLDAGGKTQLCAATTSAGKPCPIEARPSGLCHVHDPTLRCSAPKRNGKFCRIITGGGPCAAHRDETRDWKVFATEAPNRFIGITRGFHIRIANRYSSGVSSHLPHIDQRLDTIEFLDLPKGHEIRPRGVFYDDKGGAYLWYLDYLYGYPHWADLEIIEPQCTEYELKQALGDGGASFDDGQIDYFNITIRRVDRGSDRYDPDSYLYYEQLPSYV